ncbi:MAG: hypothetical protein LBT48_05695 [Prevotellaceae bacterium]|jgi:hypothetical protein|nr:hypothetical protein [Prevotellaceae bacterium]
MKKKNFTLTDEFRRNAFTTPDGYFESLSVRIIETVAAAKRQPPLSWRQALRPQMAFAAGFVALVIAGYGGVRLLDSLSPATDPAVPASLEDFYAASLDMKHLNEETALHVIHSDETNDHSVNTEDIINYLASTRMSLADIASLE